MAGAGSFASCNCFGSAYRHKLTCSRVGRGSPAQEAPDCVTVAPYRPGSFLISTRNKRPHIGADAGLVGHSRLPTVYQFNPNRSPQHVQYIGLQLECRAPQSREQVLSVTDRWIMPVKDGRRTAPVCAPIAGRSPAADWRDAKPPQPPVSIASA